MCCNVFNDSKLFKSCVSSVIKLSLVSKHCDSSTNCNSESFYPYNRLFLLLLSIYYIFLHLRGQKAKMCYSSSLRLSQVFGILAVCLIEK